MFINTLFEDPVRFFMIFLIVVFSVCLHEFFHAFTAVKEGDESLREHLTLNPLKQMGVMSIIMLLFLGIAWGAVPVNRELLRRKQSILYISLAGPFANFLLLILSFVLFLFSYRWGGQGALDQAQMNTLYFLLITMGVYNFVLLIFNLLPIPGLDGWHILQYFLPRKMELRSEWVKGIMAGMILGAFFFIPYLFQLGYFVFLRSASFILE